MLLTVAGSENDKCSRFHQIDTFFGPRCFLWIFYDISSLIRFAISAVELVVMVVSVAGS